MVVHASKQITCKECGQACVCYIWPLYTERSQDLHWESSCHTLNHKCVYRDLLFPLLHDRLTHYHRIIGCTGVC